MTTTVRQANRISPQDVRPTLDRHMLADGLPFVVDLEKSEGAYLYDSLTGRRILDLFTCFSTCPLGYNHPGLQDEQFRSRLLPAALNKPSSSDIYTEAMAEFVRAFARTVPEPLRHRMFFIEGGALAVENALKTAFDWKTRKNLQAGRNTPGDTILHFREAFHGRSGYTLSLTNTDPTKTDYFPMFDWPRIDNPKLSFPRTETVEREVEQVEARALDQIDAALEQHGERIAGLILEPIQGEGGDNHFRKRFLQALRSLADEREFLLLFDEVQTGFGTTGRWWCSEHFEVFPDVFAFGKKTQVCGICASARVDEVESVFQTSSRINSTWGGNLVDMVRCTRYVEIIEEEGLLSQSTKVGNHLLDGLRQIADSSSGVMTNCRGRGMFLAFDLPDGATRDRTLATMLDADVLGLSSGERSIRFRPALSLTSSEADEALERISRALATVARSA